MILGDLDRLWQRMGDFSEIPPDVQTHWSHVKRWLSQYMSRSTLSFQSIDLYPFLRSVVERVKQAAAHRDIRYEVEGENDLYITMEPDILADVLEGLLKNAVENTPDGGLIKVSAAQKDETVAIRVTDYGVGIEEEHLRYLFDGLFDTREPDLYTSKKPYDFGAGGKGFDLLRIKMYGKRFGFDISVESRRCAYIPGTRDVCPGSVAECEFAKDQTGCAASGGTTFTVSFPLKRGAEHDTHFLFQ